MNKHISKGYTLVEKLLVIAILAISIGMTLPYLQPDREKARLTQCVNNMRQLGMAAHSYHESKGRFPSSCQMKSAGDSYYMRIPDGYSWLVELLPFLEEKALFDLFDVKLGSPNDAESDKEVRKGISRRLEMFLCPSSDHEPSGLMDSYEDNKQGITNYVVLSATHAESLKLSVEYDARGCNYDAAATRPDGAIYPGSKTTLEGVKDGADKTILSCETTDEFRRWAVGADASVVALPTSGSGASKSVTFINKFEGESDGYRYAALAGFQPGKFNDKTTIKEENRLSYLNWIYDDFEWCVSDGYFDVISEKATGIISKTPSEALGQIRKGVSSYHNGVIVHGLCDASVINISVKTDPQIYMFMTTTCQGDPSEMPE